MRRSSRPVVLPRFPFPHGHAFDAWRLRERRRQRRASVVRHGLLIVLGLIIGGLIGLSLPLPAPRAATALHVTGYAVSLAPSDATLSWDQCVAMWDAGETIDDRCAY